MSIVTPRLDASPPSPGRRFSVRSLARGLIAALAMAGWSVSASAAPLEEEQWIDLGQADSLAIDQPRVMYQLHHAETGTVDGPDLMFAQALLDTGANGIVLATRAYWDLESTDIIDEDRYAVATRDDGSKVQYEELGVAGTELFDVLEEYHLQFNGYSADASPHMLENVRPIGNPGIDFGSFSGIVGMPAMMDRRVTLDLRTLLDPEPLSDEDPEFLLPYIKTTLEPLTSTNDTQGFTTSAADAGEGEGVADNQYRIEFRMWEPPHSDPLVEGDPQPTFAPMPFVDDVAISTGGPRAEGSFLLDTGAQLTLISEGIAERAGIDLEEDAIDYLQLGGVGGSVMAPVVAIDFLDIPALRMDGEEEDKLNLRFSEFHVAVLDIGEELIEDPLDGILGMNLLTSGYAEAVIEMLFGEEGELGDVEVTEEDMEQGFFETFSFAFSSDSEQQLGGFDVAVAPQYNRVVPEPGTLALLAPLLGALLVRRRRAATAR